MAKDSNLIWTLHVVVSLQTGPLHWSAPPSHSQQSNTWRQVEAKQEKDVCIQRHRDRLYKTYRNWTPLNNYPQFIIWSELRICMFFFYIEDGSFHPLDPLSLICNMNMFLCCLCLIQDKEDKSLHCLNTIHYWKRGKLLISHFTLFVVINPLLSNWWKQNFSII